MFRIGEFSRLCRVPVSALRYYADIGLLEPLHIDRFTGYRYYDLEQLPRLNRILALKDLGLSLEQIGQVLNENLGAGEIRGMLRLKEAELEQELAEREARLARVRARLRQIEAEGQPLPAVEVVLKSVAPQTMLTRREIAPTPAYTGALIGEMMQAVMSRGFEINGVITAVFHDEEFKPTDLDIEVAFPLVKLPDAPLELAPGRAAFVRELPAIESAACIIHTGAYDHLEDTYHLLNQWIVANGCRVAGASRELYLRPPGGDGLLTEIQFPVTQG